MNRKNKTRRKSALFITIAALFLIFGCKSEKDKSQADKDKTETADKNASPAGLTPEQAALTVAKVGEQTLTVGDITEQINKLSPYIRRRWAAPEKRKEFLDNLIRMELLSQEAKRLGLDKDDAEVDRVADQVMIRLMIKNDLEKELIPSSIDEDVLKEEYEKEKDKYLRPEQVRASHILVKTEAEADKLLADLKKHTESRYFKNAAAERSLDENTKKSGGDLGYFGPDGEKGGDAPKVDPAVAAAAWNLKKVGDVVSEPVKTAEGFHIVKLTNKRPKLERSFESVKRMLENRMLRKKRKEAMDKFVSDLQSKAKVKIFEDNLAKLKFPEEPPMPRMKGERPRPPKGKSGALPARGKQKPKPKDVK
jgi:peptidyl-prolyl cis-trans isomerase C